MFLISYPVNRGMVKQSAVLIIHSTLIADIAFLSLYWNDFPGPGAILKSRKAFQEQVTPELLCQVDKYFLQGTLTKLQGG